MIISKYDIYYPSTLFPFYSKAYAKLKKMGDSCIIYSQEGHHNHHNNGAERPYCGVYSYATHPCECLATSLPRPRSVALSLRTRTP